LIDNHVTATNPGYAGLCVACATLTITKDGHQMNMHLLRICRNHLVILAAIRNGMEYMIHPYTSEMHRLDVDMCPALRHADLRHYDQCRDIGLVRVDRLPDGTIVPFVDLLTGASTDYVVDKCQWCYPRPARSR
jgi:hypothetical protein